MFRLPATRQPMKPLVAMSELSAAELHSIARAYGSSELITPAELETITALLDSPRTRQLTPEER